MQAGGGARVPAPWTLHGEAHVQLFHRPRQGRAALAPNVSVRRGGLGALALVRYTDSDVGAYDELLWLSPWGLQVGSRRMHHVERIYVSTQASCINGRLNWGIPKQLAAFEVERSSPCVQRFRVITPEGSVARFVVESGRRALSFGSGVIPARVRQLGQLDAEHLFEMAPAVRGRVSRARFSELESDPELFMDVRDARRLIAFSVWDGELRFPVARVRSLADADADVAAPGQVQRQSIPPPPSNAP